MRRHVAPFITALLAVMCLWAGSPHAARLVQLPGGGADVRCSTVDSCVAANKWMLGIRSERELGNDRITILIPGYRGWGYEVDYRRGDSLRALIASHGRSGQAYAANQRRHNAARFAAAHRAPVRTAARYHAAPKAAPADAAATPAAARAAQPSSSTQAALLGRLDALTKNVAALTQQVETFKREVATERAALARHTQESEAKIATLTGERDRALATSRAVHARLERLSAKGQIWDKTDDSRFLPTIAIAGIPLPDGWIIGAGLVALALIAGAFGLGRYARRPTRMRPARAMAGTLVSCPTPTNLGDLKGRPVRYGLKEECVAPGSPSAFDAVIADVKTQIRDLGDGPAATGVLMGYGPWDRKPSGGFYDNPCEIGYIQKPGYVLLTDDGLERQLKLALEGDTRSPRSDRVRRWAEENEYAITTGPGRGGILEPQELRQAA